MNDNAHAPMNEQAAEYQRLQAALARLAALPNSVEAWFEVGNYEVSIRSLKHYDDYDASATKHATLLEACEAALSTYDALKGGSE